MHPEKPDGATRLLFQNVNGFKKNSKEDTLEDIVRLQQAHGIDVVGVTEHHQDTTMLTRKMALSETVHRTAPGQAACQFDSCQETTITGTQMGGTGITVIGALVSSLDAQGRGGDSMGRWSFIHLRRKTAPPITVITAYQVCKSTKYLNGQTAFHQQSGALEIEGRTLHPGEAFIEDLTKQIKAFQAQGHDIILGGDFNETIEDSRSGILRLSTATNLCDPWYLRNTDAPLFRTYDRGSKRLDSVFMSEGLISCITHLGYAPFARYLNSDHRGLYLEFDTARLLGQTKDVLPGLPFRAVKTADKQSVTQYVEHMYDHLLANAVFAKRSTMDSDMLTSEEIERIDANLGDAGNSGESHCRRRRAEWYSLDLVQTRFQVQLLRGQLSALKHGKDRLAGLQERMDSLGIQFDIPTSIPAVRVALNVAEKRLQRKQSTSEKLRRAENQGKIDVASTPREKARAVVLKKIIPYSWHRPGLR